MGIRDRLNEHRVATSVVAGIAALVALSLVYWQLRAPSGLLGSGRPQEFYSVDDGKSWFPDDAAKLPPFEHEGKTAYRVRVFKCAGGKPFVSHLERYTDADKKKLEAAFNQTPRPSGPAAMQLMMTAGSVEVKRPGDPQWVKSTPAAAEERRLVMQPKCPDGNQGAIEPVRPG